MDSRTIIKLIERDGWRLVRVTGSHHHFHHHDRAGTTTVIHPCKDVKTKTLRSVEKQSGVMVRK